jgi:tRNA (cmo5U34)-methyltransferase
LGNTVNKFVVNGYANVQGVDSSPAMVKYSLHPTKILLSNTLPNKDWDVVLANWTLHFMQDRKQYLQSIYTNLKSGGLFIMSDKMDYSLETEKLYHNFKRSNGVSEEVLQEKQRSLIGVLTTMPLSWYLQTLEELGFCDIQVVNTRYMFSTIYARKF